ncbi:SRPBCC domain-containing protein [Nesterenkonia sp.]|uniref:SRPBCC domain-containing protein n=1 Tax=Nesterenkonia sp. TaxID=704201 RepID=UPI002614C436|nr:SRPBCC domain-containing protein [Nesterenkonia sp.]
MTEKPTATPLPDKSADESASLADVLRHGDRYTLRFRRRLATTVADAWSAISEPDRIARWFAPVTIENRRWITYWDNGREYAAGQILSCEPEEHLEVSWRATDDVDSAMESVLRISLHPEADGVLLVLQHERLHRQDVEQYGAGWHAFLEGFPGGGEQLNWGERFRSQQPHYRGLASP